jgi:hypothetical protein
MMNRRQLTRRPAARRAYTLIELLVATASSTILVGGLASSLLIASRPLAQDATPAADANRSAMALAQLSADLRHALRFTERTATAITFTIPDRNGDQLPEIIRYSWSGTLGDSLMYQINSEPALAVASDVKQFNLTALNRVIAADATPPPPPPVVYETFTEAKAGSDVQSLNIALPAGATNGKLLIAAVAVDGAAGSSLTAPAGWTLLSAVNGGGQIGLAVWWKIAGAAEPATYTFAWTGPEQAYGWIMRFSGANVIAPVNTFATSMGVGSTPLCPSVAPTEGYTLILRVGGFDGDKINVNNAGMASHTTISVDSSSSSGGNSSGGAAYKYLDTPISTGTSNFTLTSSQQYVTFTLAIAPQP